MTAANAVAGVRGAREAPADGRSAKDAPAPAAATPHTAWI